MKHLLLTTIAAVLLVGCGESKAPDISIHEAAKDGNIEAVKHHLAAGTDVNAKNAVGNTPLYYAAFGGRKEVVELLIAEGADVDTRGDDGVTPLRVTVVVGHKEIVELLIAKGADVNEPHLRWTLLHSAAGKGHKEIAELLIANGADVNAKDEDGDTPLDFAIDWKRTEKKEVADLIRKHGGKTGEELKGGEPVAEAAKPEPPTAKAPDISIHSAAFEGNIEAVKQHLAAGTDVNAKGGVNGETPLDLAIAFKHTELADLLRKHGGKTGEELKAEGK